MDHAALVREAAARFDKGDDEGFVACFGPAPAIYGEPELADAPVVSSRTQLEKALATARSRLDGGSAKLANVEEQGAGIVADLIILPPESGSAGAWRMALAIRFARESIAEVRAFWQRESAAASLRRSG